MAILLNRKYGSRLECLFYILLAAYKKFGTGTPFYQGDLKFDDADAENVHKYCKLLTPCLGLDCCRFLDNPLSPAKCYATQAKNCDSTKAKAVSDVCGALEALGFIERERAGFAAASAGKRKAAGKNRGRFLITEKGEKWVKAGFGSAEWTEIARESVLSYGPLVGFLSKLRDLSDEFSYSGIYLGYPKTEEYVEYTPPGGAATKIVKLSTNSKKDSNTRTVSSIIGWCVSTGLLIPLTTDGVNPAETLPQLRYRDFVNQGGLTVRNFKKSETVKKLFDKRFFVENPLSYKRLHKDVDAMRENGSVDTRMATKQNLGKILDRRFVFVKALNYCGKNGLALDFDRLVSEMEKHSLCFFSPGNKPSDIMASESEIADIAGLPFGEDSSGLLVPLTVVNEQVLEEDAPPDTIALADSIIKDIFI